MVRVRNERGFTMLVVLMAVLLMGVAGAAALTVTSGDTLASGARANRSHALAAAEAGMAIFVRTATVSRIVNQWQVGNLPPSTLVVPFVQISAIDTDGNGANDLFAEYRVWGGVGGGPIADTADVVSEGRVIDRDGNVLGTAMLNAKVLKCGGAGAQAGQEGMGASGGGTSGYDSSSCNYRTTGQMNLGAVIN